jgi:response regulator RpfG family c-di-GMP phosphodiesterase
LVLDDDRVQFSIIYRLITRFGYDVKRITTIDEIFDSLDENPLDFILVNLGTKKFDINELVRRGFSNMDLKRVPLVAYKDMDEGLFVHEMISGLNRLTRFIISPQELYSFLVDILFRKELLPLMKVMNQAVSFDLNEQFCEESISQIYFSQSCSLFELFDILTEENIETMLHLVALFKKTIVKVDGFRWLKKISEKRVTCGVGAGSFGSL